jgi:hypothetical protein
MTGALTIEEKRGIAMHGLDWEESAVKPESTEQNRIKLALEAHKAKI